MGFRKHKRPVLAPGGLQVGGGSTFTGAVTISGAVTQSGAVTHTANVTYSTGAREIEHVQVLAGTDTGTNVTNYGVTRITVESSANGTAIGILPFSIDNPVAGVTKTIIVDNNSTKIIHVRTVTSATGQNFYGSTKNAVVWSTGGTGPPPAIDLIGVSTSIWAVKTFVTTSTALTAALAANRVTIAGATA